MASVTDDPSPEIVHRCPTLFLQSFNPAKNRARSSWFLTGLHTTWVFSKVTISPDKNLLARVKVGPGCAPGRIVEFGLCAISYSSEIVIAPIMSDNPDSTPVARDFAEGDKSLVRGISGVGSLPPGFVLAAAGDPVVFHLGFVVRKKYPYLGVYVWNGSGAALVLSGWFVVEELVK
jgi:hypothetical protein